MLNDCINFGNNDVPVTNHCNQIFPHELLSICHCNCIVIFLETTKGVEFYVCEVENIHTDKIKWNGVKQINNIEYIRGETKQPVEASTKVRMWQSWKIGPGKVYRWKDFGNAVIKICPLKIISSTNVVVPWVDDSSKKAGMNSIFMLN